MAHKNKAEYNAYMKQYMLNRYNNKKAVASELLGNKCKSCGSLERLEFDHIDPNTKKKTIAQMWSYSEKKFLDEVAKCQLLCKACHQEKSLKDQGLQSGKLVHGTSASSKYCKCNICRNGNIERCKAYRLKKKNMPS